MKPKILFIVALYALSVIGLTDGIGVFSLAANPASLLIGLPFTVTGVSSGTLAALGALKLLAATALALSYTGTVETGAGSPPYGYGGGGGGYIGGNSAYAPAGTYGVDDGYGGGGGGGAEAGAYGANAYGGNGNIYKRSIDNNIGNWDLYFHVINEVDANNCALRLICELESNKNKTTLQEDERMILALFSPKPKEIPAVEKLKTPSGPYQFAAYVGATSSLEECGKFYGKCPYGATQMMTALRAASAQP